MGVEASLAFGHEFSRTNEGIEGWADQIGFPLRTFRDRLQAAAVLLVVQLILDDAQQPLIELQQGLYLRLVLRIQVLLPLYLFNDALHRPAQLFVLLLQALRHIIIL